MAIHIEAANAVTVRTAVCHLELRNGCDSKSSEVKAVHDWHPFREALCDVTQGSGNIEDQYGVF